ncbi:hypothetical protein JZ751_004729 [Albula glossodonta]|uniref:FXYD domain-containing ion transport regulator n=1 Tax=Albula glossodonta TaxID=121402 RepID=A0A8T2NCA4_9TELE|nr:hypothetical protein JZ751_004729 [Albula glossodonta]
MSQFSTLVLLAVACAFFTEAEATTELGKEPGVLWEEQHVVRGVGVEVEQALGKGARQRQLQLRSGDMSSIAVGESYIPCSTMAKISALVLVTVLSLAYAEEKPAEDDPFTFDYHRLRVGGLILAAVLCLIGITILLSGHCRCKFNQDRRRRTGSSAAAQQMLNDAGLVRGFIPRT